MLQIAIRPPSNAAINRSTIYASAVLNVAFCVSLLKVAIDTFFSPLDAGRSVTDSSPLGNTIW